MTLAAAATTVVRAGPLGQAQCRTSLGVRSSQSHSTGAGLAQVTRAYHGRTEQDQDECRVGHGAEALRSCRAQRRVQNHVGWLDLPGCVRTPQPPAEQTTPPLLGAPALAVATSTTSSALGLASSAAAPQSASLSSTLWKSTSPEVIS